MKLLIIVIAAVIGFLVVGELIIYMRLLCIEEKLKLLKKGCGFENEAAEERWVKEH